MHSTSVYINASELRCSKIKDEFTQESLSQNQLINEDISKKQVDPQHVKFQYKPIDHKKITESHFNKSNSRIFETLFEVFDSLLNKHKLNKRQLANTSLFLGSSSMDIGEIQSCSQSSIWLTPFDKITKTLSDKYGLNELSFTFNTACTSSANAIIYATRLLKTKRIERAIILGCEFYNQLTINGFSSLGLLSKSALLAFSNNRNGMILGEGVGVLVLSTKMEKQDDLEILSGHSACDTFSLTAAKEDGSHIAGVIKKSIEMAGIKSQDIDLIKVHGTASSSSDDAELNSLKNVFSKIPPIIAFKPFTGHTLGASAAIETAITHQSIQNNELPIPSYAKLSQQCLLPFAKKETNINDYQFILHNYCGFGGNNAAIVLKNTNYVSK